MGPFADGWTTADVERVITRDDPAEVLYVPIVVGMHAPDCGGAWAEVQCLRLASHRDANVRANVLTGLGHVARTCGTLALDRVLPVLRAGLSDASADVRASAQDALGDLQTFMREALAAHPLAAGLRGGDPGGGPGVPA